jgi:hypothetical protein
MNTFTKKYLKFALIVFFIGVVISTIGFSMGGKIIDLQIRDLTDVTESYSGVKSLNLDISASEIEVKSGSEFKIEASNVSKNSFKSYVQDGKWYIQDKMIAKIFNISNNYSKVVIYIPVESNLNELTINMGAGRFTAAKLNSITTDIKVGAGDLRIYDLTTDEINIDCGVGNAEINGTVNNKGYIKSGIGNVSLGLKGNEKDYNYDLTLGIGEVTLNSKSLAGMGNKIVNNTSSNKNFKIESGIGKISLKINE